jgi:DNA modification methylase
VGYGSVAVNIREELFMIYQGDALTILKTLGDETIDCCVTSPPYFNLRDYGRDGQIGLESSPEEYIQKLVEVFREVRRVLKKDGTLWVNIADSYAGSGKGAFNYPDNAKKHKQGTNKGSVGSYIPKTTAVNCKPKDLIGIPWMLAFALRADGWYLRQDIIWSKPNPMPESVKDRCTKSHEYIFLLSKNRKYYFDSEAIAEPVAESTIKRISQDVENQQGSYTPSKANGRMKAAVRYGGKKYTENPDVFHRTKSGGLYEYRPKRNKRDVWVVTTKPFKGAHFATFPADLIEPCILAGCPEGGVVLDPFAGSGTTGMVARQNKRNFVLIELNDEYVKLCEDRTKPKEK